MSKSDKDFSIFTIAGKICLIIFSPIYLSIILVFAIIGFLIDIIFTIIDLKNLGNSETSERISDRFENRINWLFDALFGYFKKIFKE